MWGGKQICNLTTAGAILITTAGAPRRGGIVLLTTSILINVKCSTGLSNQITIVGASHLTNVLDITTPMFSSKHR